MISPGPFEGFDPWAEKANSQAANWGRCQGPAVHSAAPGNLVAGSSDSVFHNSRPALDRRSPHAPHLYLSDDPASGERVTGCLLALRELRDDAPAPSGQDPALLRSPNSDSAWA